MKQVFIGFVYVDGELFTHHDGLMGTTGSTRKKVVNQLRENVFDLLTENYINTHNVELKVRELKTPNFETIQL